MNVAMVLGAAPSTLVVALFVYLAYLTGGVENHRSFVSRVWSAHDSLPAMSV